jgi:hypothetical protein
MKLSRPHARPEAGSPTLSCGVPGTLGVTWAVVCCVFVPRNPPARPAVIASAAANAATTIPAQPNLPKVSPSSAAP